MPALSSPPTVHAGSSGDLSRQDTATLRLLADCAATRGELRVATERMQTTLATARSGLQVARRNLDAVNAYLSTVLHK